MTANSSSELSLDYCETCFTMVEKNNLGEFMHLRVDSHPNTNGVAMKTGSAEYDAKVKILHTNIIVFVWSIISLN